jgi:hypothetical protein
MKILSHCQKMRSEIHKLNPEDLEDSIIEKSITQSGTNGPNEDPIGGQKGASTYVCTDETYKLLFGISQTTFMKNNLNISSKKCRCVISQMNNGRI